MQVVKVILNKKHKENLTKKSPKKRNQREHQLKPAKELVAIKKLMNP